MNKKPNFAQFGVTFPDGCRHWEKTDRGADIADDAVKFGRWMIAAGEEVVERATRMGRCCRRDEAQPVRSTPRKTNRVTPK